jgi:hypothetical protein
LRRVMQRPGNAACMRRSRRMRVNIVNVSPSVQALPGLAVAVF